MLRLSSRSLRIKCLIAFALAGPIPVLLITLAVRQLAFDSRDEAVNMRRPEVRAAMDANLARRMDLLDDAIFAQELFAEVLPKLAAAAVTLSLMFFAYAVRSALDPIEHITGELEEISRGKTHKRLRIERNNEAGRLCNALNRALNEGRLESHES